MMTEIPKLMILLVSGICAVSGTVNANIGMPTLNIRLVNGSGVHEGRVELQVDGVWGTVCDVGFDIADARVICRQLGLPSRNSLVRRHAFFGEGTGPVLLVDARCDGTETRLQDCDMSQGTFGVVTHSCSGSRPYDAGVVCAPPAAPGHSCRFDFMCTDHAVCRNGQCECRSTHHNTDDGTCARSYTRLANGPSRMDGRVEVYGDTWRPVCGDHWGMKDATVVCRQLGFNSTSVIPRGRVWNGPGKADVYLDEFECTGLEEKVVRCRHKCYAGASFESNCTHMTDAGATCGGTFDMRLANGTSAAEGRVEVAINGEWGTVCDGQWDQLDAQVICRQLGLPSGGAIAWNSERFGEGSGRVWMTNMVCRGTESSVWDCPDTYGNVATYEDACPHSRDVGVTCREYTGPPPTPVPGGPGEACNNASDPQCVQHAVCDRRSVCQCQSQYQADTVAKRCQRIGDIRLMDGRWGNEGRVEVWNGTVWGSVCDDYWDVRAATVVCRQLGLNSSAVLPWGLSYFGLTSNLPVVMSSVECLGHEDSLMECRMSDTGPPSCNKWEEAGVMCGATMEIRLAGGGRRSGRVEIGVNGQWGTMCDYQMDREDVEVICTQLGLPTSSSSISASIVGYGWGSGPIFLRELKCVGWETSLLDCPTSAHGPLGRFDKHQPTFCNHFDDVAVIC